jgi:pimeloyl-ACP methyl ester carboxylesterase
MIQDAGHAPFSEKPEKVFELIHDFLTWVCRIEDDTLL